MLIPANLKRQVEVELARRSLAEFVRQSWHVIEPGTPLSWGWALDAICEHVQALVEDRLGTQNLDINVPPGSMKSTIVSVCLPSWMWIHAPGWRVICTSGSDEIAQRDQLRCRDILVSEWYQQSFRPQWELSRDQNTKHLFKNTLGGWRRAMSAGARITGARGDCLVVDDPNDAQEAYSKAERDRIITWWDQAAVNRLNDLASGKRIIIQQRLHEEDLTGHVLRKNRAIWDCLVIRQEYERPQPSDPDAMPTGLGWTDPRKVEGELFFPERFPESVVEEEKIAKGSSGYAGQHQQRPAPLGGGLVKIGWFKRYGAPPANPIRIIQSWDTAMKTGEINDPSVCTTWAETETGYYLLDVLCRRMEYPDLKRAMQSLAARWNPSVILVEDKASGQSVIQDLQRSTVLPIIPVEPRGEKVVRLVAVSALIESGRVFLPESALWLMDFESEVMAFPNAVHDDQVDSMSQALGYLTGGSTGLIDYYRQMAQGAA